MDFLTQVVERKKEEVSLRKKETPLEVLKDAVFYQRERISLKDALLREGSSQIIAEIKRASPSKGLLHADLDVARVARGYLEAGVSGISILTDLEGFGGSIDDILLVRDFLSCPILRKDFTIDAYQIEEARAIGADVILLIASALSPELLGDLSQYAKEIGLEVLLEVHDADEIETHVNPYIDFLGVNNRNLKTLKVDISTSFELASRIGKEHIAISESGISNPEAIIKLRTFGYRGFLIGENFMKHPDPGLACKEFISKTLGDQ
jgi:indole-3-glycerol phosphate synthase